MERAGGAAGCRPRAPRLAAWRHVHYSARVAGGGVRATPPLSARQWAEAYLFFLMGEWWW